MIPHHCHKSKYVQYQNYACRAIEPTSSKSHLCSLPKCTVPILLPRNGDVTLPSWKMLEKSCRAYEMSHAPGRRAAGLGQDSLLQDRGKKGSCVLPMNFLCITGTWGPVRSDQQGIGDLMRKKKTFPKAQWPIC